MATKKACGLNIRGVLELLSRNVFFTAKPQRFTQSSQRLYIALRTLRFTKLLYKNFALFEVKPKQDHELKNLGS
jgi:hypothetical protein